MKKQLFMIISVVILALTVFMAGCVADKKGVNGETSNPEPGVEQTEKEEDDETADAEADEENSNQDESQEDLQEDVKQDEAEIQLDESKAVVMKTTANVNFRKAAGTSGEIIKLLSKGVELKKYAEENGWALVKVGDEVGYVSENYLVDPAEVTETPATTSKIEAIPGQHRDPNRIVVVIDPGHQGKGDSTKEPNGPGSTVMKARVTSGAAGKFTGVAEYILNLDVALKLKTELQNRGYTVYMTRESHDVNISNMERAQYATSVGADIAVRIHANGSNDTNVKGALTMAPSKNNPYVSHLANASYSLSKKIIDAYCAATGFENDGVLLSDTMTGMNWSEVPVTIVEMGYMSNQEDDTNMQNPIMQNNMVQGIANGIDAYFGL